MKTRLLLARWVFDGRHPPLRDGAVAIEQDRIAAVGGADQLRRRYADATVEDLGARLLLPGLVNAHTHLELSHATRPDAAPKSFADWLLNLASRSPGGAEPSPEAINAAVDEGVRQCRRFGVTTVGDISRHCAVTRARLKQTGLRGVSFGEALGLAKRRAQFDERLAAALDDSDASERLRVGLSPHAPYTVDVEGYRQCVQLASKQHLPLATHLAESPDEEQFLSHHRGPFRRLWDLLETWSDDVPRFEGGPVRMAAAVGLLDVGAVLAHVNYCDDEEMQLLARGRASVVWCPRTHAWFGHPPHRWREMLGRGINVAIGTDSCASSPDLNLLDDLRLVRGQAPEVDELTLWSLVTWRGARALGMEGQVGELAPGAWADVIAFDAAGNRPLMEVLEDRSIGSSGEGGGGSGGSTSAASGRRSSPP